MKKILLLVIIFIVCKNLAQAQSANLKVINNTDHVIDVRVYGYAPSYCSSYSCSTSYYTDIHLIAWGWPTILQTFGPSDPCAVSVTPGWTHSSCTTPWCSSLPTDFQWTYAEINLNNGAGCWGSIFPIIVGDNTIGCGGASSTTPTFSGCGSFPNLKAIWNTTGGSLADVVIEVREW